MSIATMVIGESGTGKSASMRNLDPREVLLIQTVRKPLPFKSKKWAPISKANPEGCVLVTDQSSSIVKAMEKVDRSIIVIDDLQYLLANEFMRRSEEVGFSKFSDIARHAWDVLMAASNLEEWKTVYLFMHSATDEAGKTRAKTIGKLLDEKITVEGLMTIVLRTAVVNGNYMFSTRNNGADTVKTPMGLFDDELIDNDLAQIDIAIREYYDQTPNERKAA